MQSIIQEIWLPILGHEGYEVSNLGRVRSLDRWVEGGNGRRFYKGKILRPGLDSDGYNYVILPSNKPRKVHRLVGFAFLGLTKDQHIDHADGNRTNNLLSNLRVCSNLQNHWNMKMLKANTSGFKGVCWSKYHGKWKAAIKFNGKTIFRGYFDTAEEAARAYDDAALRLFGQFAKTNKSLRLMPTEAIQT